MTGYLDSNGLDDNECVQACIAEAVAGLRSLKSAGHIVPEGPPGIMLDQVLANLTEAFRATGGTQAELHELVDQVEILKHAQ